jgi:hypothetical protein
MELQEYSRFEERYGGKRELCKTFRVTRTLHEHLTTEAMSRNSDESTVIRHALVEYLERRGHDAFRPLGA